MPRMRHVPAVVAEWAAAPRDECSTSGMPVIATLSRPPANHATATTNSSRPGRSPRSMRRPRTSSMARRKIGSAEANRTAKMRTSGTARSNPRPTAPSHTGARRGPSPRGGRARPIARPIPASMPSSAQAPIASTTDAERRVTARPENAAIEAPVNTAAPSMSRKPTNGSARIATNPARTSAVTGSQASSGSGARPLRRSSQAGPEHERDDERDVDADGRVRGGAARRRCR